MPVTHIDPEIASVLAGLGDYMPANLSKKLTPNMDIDTLQPNVQVFCVRWSPDAQFLAAGSEDGVIRVYNSKGQQAYELNSAPNSNLPTTCVRFRPLNRDSKTKNVLISANADGSVQHWHMTSQKRLFHLEETDNQIYAYVRGEKKMGGDISDFLLVHCFDLRFAR